MKSLPLLFLCVLPALATPITVVFTGHITGSDLAGISVGDTFNGRMTFETDAPVLADNGTFVNYANLDSRDGISINVDGFTFEGLSYLNLLVANGLGTDFVQGSADGVFGSLATTYPGITLDSVAAMFLGDASFLSSNAVPDPFRTDHVISGSGSILLDNEISGFSVSGPIDSVAVVPEPATSLSLASAFAALIGLAKLNSSRGTSRSVVRATDR